MRRFSPARLLFALLAVTLVGGTLTLPMAAQASGVPAPSQLATPVPDKHARPEMDPTTVLVRFRGGLAATTATSLLQRHGLSYVSTVAGTGFSVVSTNGQPPARVVSSLRGNAAVVDVQPNYLRRATATPNDTYYAQYQASYMNLVRLPAAWDLSKGSTAVKIAVIDTGVDLNTPDLAGRILAGYDFVHHDTQAWDDNGHGTMVAGIAAAVTNNSKGVAGAAWTADVIPVKVLDGTGVGTDANVASGITWAADHGARIINLSLGGPGSSDVLAAAVAYATGKGAVVIAAAGNDGSSSPSYPAAIPAVVSVAATDHSGLFTWFSNWGWTIDLAAPGVNIVSTYMANGTGESYATGSGTSFSAPLVAGVAALVRAKYPTWSWSDVIARLKSSARDVGPRGIDSSYGWGQLDAYAALGGTKQAPAAVPARDSLEPNGTAAQARTLTASATSTISPESDEDWFATTFNAVGSAAVTVTPPKFVGTASRNMDPVVSVFGPDLKQVAFGDSNGPGGKEIVTVPVATAGKYTIAVDNYLGSQSPGAYTISVTSTAGQVPLVFGPYQHYAGGYRLNSMATGDINGDGLIDAVTADDSEYSTKSSILVYLQQADGSFASPVSVHTGDHPQGLVFVDVSGDGALDLLLVSSKGLELFVNSGGGFSTSTVISGQTYILQTMDMDGDGRVDLLFDNGQGPHYLANTTSGWVDRAFSTVTPISSSAGGSRVGDLNGDGLLDIVSLWNYSAMEIYTNNGDGTFSHRFQPLSSAYSGLILHDMTGDGRLDIVVRESGGSAPPQIQVFAQMSDGTLAKAVTYPLSGTGGFREGDLNGDGLTDLLFTYPTLGEIGMFLQQPDGTLGSEILAPAPLAPTGNTYFSIADLNGDGLADIGLARPDPNNSQISGFYVLPQFPQDEPLWVRSFVPGDFASGVSRTANLTVTFGTDIDPASLSTTTVRLASGITNASITRTVSYSAATRTLTIDPSSTLGALSPYTLFITGLRDTNGRQLQSLAWARFTSGS